MMAAFIWKKSCIQLKTVVYTLYETLLRKDALPFNDV